MSKKTTTFVLVSWNRRAEVLHTLGQLEPLRNQVEVILVDNGSGDDTCEMVRQEHPWVNLIALKENTGIYAYNYGAQYAETPYLVFLDDDSYPSENVVDESERLFSSRPEVGIIAFEIVIPDTGEIVTTEHVAGPVAEFWGCGFAIRKETWDRLNGYDSDFFLYVNENDLAIRCWDLGMAVIYHPQVRSYHCVSSANRMSGRMLRNVVRNNIYLILKNIPRRYWPRCFTPMLLTMFVRAIVTRQIRFWLAGVNEGFSDCAKYIAKRKPVSEEVVRFYLKKYKQYEWPLAKLARKQREGSKWSNLKYR